MRIIDVRADDKAALDMLLADGWRLSSSVHVPANSTCSSHNGKEYVMHYQPAHTVHYLTKG